MSGRYANVSGRWRNAHRSLAGTTALQEVNTTRDPLYGNMVGEMAYFPKSDELTICVRYDGAIEVPGCGLKKILPLRAT